MSTPSRETRPLVSIGLPVFDGIAYLDRAVASLLAQDHAEIELIISDNHSGDGTWERAQELAAADDRIRLVRQEQTVPVMDNFGAALAPARGDLFMWAAVDDQWEPTFVSALLAELDRRPNAVVAMSAVRHSFWESDEVGDEIHFVGRHDPRTRSPLGRALDQAGSRAPYFQYLYGIYRTAFLRDAFVRYPLSVSSDGLFAIQVALAGEWGYVDEVLTTRLVRRAPWPERYEHDALAKAIGHPMAEVRLVAIAGPYLLRSRVIPWRRKLAVPLVVLQLAVRWLPVAAGNQRLRLRHRFASTSGTTR